MVLGDVILDQYIIGDCDRISPEAPVPVVSISKEYMTLGGAANVALNLVKLGLSVGLIGIIGDDESGEELNKKLNEHGIKSYLSKQERAVTTKKTRVVSSGQQIVRVDRERKLERGEVPVEDIIGKIKDYKGKVLVISDYGKGVITERLLEETKKVTQSRNIKLIIDPKGKNWNKYKGVYMVKPNFKELQEVANISITNKNSEVGKLAEEVREKYEIENLLVTRSEKGMSLVCESWSEHFKTARVEVFDVSGAGDTSLAVIAFMLHQNKTLKEAIEKSILASSYVISKKGTYAISKKEFDSL